MKSNLKDIRESAGKKQEEVAKDLGMSLSTYRSWEQGNRRLSGEALIMLSEYFGVSSDSIIGTVFSERKTNCKRSLTDQEALVLSRFNILNDAGKSLVMNYIEDLIASCRYEKKEAENHPVPNVEDLAIA